MTFFENKYGFGIGGGLVLLKPLGIVLIRKMGEEENNAYKTPAGKLCNYRFPAGL